MSGSILSRNHPFASMPSYCQEIVLYLGANEKEYSIYIEDNPFEVSVSNLLISREHAEVALQKRDSTLFYVIFT